MSNGKMKPLEAWYRRNFCTVLDYSGKRQLKLGELFYTSSNGTTEFIYVGKGKMWLKDKK